MRCRLQHCTLNSYHSLYLSFSGVQIEVLRSRKSTAYRLRTHPNTKSSSSAVYFFFFFFSFTFTESHIKMVIIGELPEIVDYEASGYDRSSGCLYQIEVYLIEIYSDDNPDMYVDFTCRFLYGGLPSPIADQTEINRNFRVNKISLAEFPDVIQWLTDAEEVPCEAGGLAVRLVTRDLIFDCPKARSVVAILTVNFVGWDYLHNDQVDGDLAERVAAAVSEVMGVGRSVARAAVEAVLADGRPADRESLAGSVAEAIERRRPAARAAVEALERFVIRDLGRETTPYCVVCMEELSAGCETTRMPCSHIFHGECISRWLMNRCDCPLCRSELPSELS